MQRRRFPRSCSIENCVTNHDRLGTRFHHGATTPPRTHSGNGARPRCQTKRRGATLALCLLCLLLSLNTRAAASPTPFSDEPALAQFAPWLALAVTDPLPVDGQHAIRSMGNRFRAKESADNVRSYLWVLLAPLAAAAGLIAFVHFRGSRSEPRSAPDRLLRELSHEHGLSSRELRTLQQMAELIGIKHPAALMVRPDRFEEAREMLRQADDERQHAFACQLRERLFGITQEDANAEEDHDGREDGKRELCRPGN